jgi:hypothetical protein
MQTSTRGCWFRRSFCCPAPLLHKVQAVLVVAPVPAALAPVPLEVTVLDKVGTGWGQRPAARRSK